MAKLKPDAITAADIEEFAKDYDDFAFEISTLKSLLDAGFVCDHGGTYMDPVQNKPRQFDIRAIRRFGVKFVRLAVECKNLRVNHPLVVSRLPRRNDESFHQVIYSYSKDMMPRKKGKFGIETVTAPARKSEVLQIGGQRSIYHTDEPVGKSCFQIGRQAGGDFSTGDTDVYDRWAQALNSASELIKDSHNDGKMLGRGVASSIVIPIVVVPNERLWVIDYDDLGNRTATTSIVNQCSFFVGRSYPSPFEMMEMTGTLTVTHIEFMTRDGLTSFLKSTTDSLGQNLFDLTDHPDEYSDRLKEWGKFMDGP